MVEQNPLIIVEGDPDIRFVADEETQEIWFVVNDVIKSLINSKNPADYLKKLRKRDKSLAAVWSTIVASKRIPSRGGMQRQNCATMEGVFRIIQAVPSPRVESVKQWLAEIGAKELNEARKEFYRRQGYSNKWIDQRESNRMARLLLTQEWHERGVKDGRDYAKLTSIISRHAFDLTVKEHKQYKGLKTKHNLRDHMSLDELAVQFMAEIATRRATQATDAQGYAENAKAARKGGEIAGEARRNLESIDNKPVITSRNFIDIPEAQELLELPEPEDANSDTTPPFQD